MTSVGNKGEAARLDIVLLFDVEDIYSPPALGNDDSIKELAQILTAERLTGTFLFIGDRAEQLKQRGREDVLDAVRQHEVGLHSRSARHPCAPEYVADCGWEEGVERALRVEAEGVGIIEAIFERRCCAISAHNVFTSPMAHRAAALLQKPYIYSYADAPPLRSLSWYAGALCLPCWPDESDPERTRAHFIGFDDTYPDAIAFAAQLERFSKWIDRAQSEAHVFMSVFMYHPQRLRLADFIDHFWAPNGLNIPRERWGRQGQPRAYTRQQVATSLVNFRRLARAIRADPRLNPTTIDQIVAKYGQPPVIITLAEIMAAATVVAQTGGVGCYGQFSAAEMTVAMAEVLLYRKAQGQFPGEVRLSEVMGPTEYPIIEPELRSCSWQEMMRRTAETLRQVKETGRLPSNLGPDYERIGINHLHVGLAQSIVAIQGGRPPSTVCFTRCPRCPPEAERIGRRFLAIGEGELVDPKLNIDGLYRHGKLQCWTLKAAV